jgi:hypothetical protein
VGDATLPGPAARAFKRALAFTSRQAVLVSVAFVSVEPALVEPEPPAAPACAGHPAVELVAVAPDEAGTAPSWPVAAMIAAPEATSSRSAPRAAKVVGRMGFSPP